MITVIALLVVLLASAPAASACEEGRIPTADGYCCWPGQTWSTQLQACLGPPQCPSGLVAEGATCLLPAIADLDWEAPYSGGPIPPGARREHRRRMSFVVAGAIVFGISWLGSVAAAIFGALYPRAACQEPSVLPIAGPIVAGYQCTQSDTRFVGVENTFEYVYAIAAPLLQAAGVALFAVGMSRRSDVLVPDRRPRVSLLPGSAGAPLGASLLIETF